MNGITSLLIASPPLLGIQAELLNIIWTSFFLIAFGVGTAKLVFLGESEIFAQMMKSAFDMAKVAFEISLGLAGVMSLWMGVMRVGERGGFLSALTRFLNPLFSKLFPDIPAGHPALGSMTMNIAANMLGLDNAATPEKAAARIETIRRKMIRYHARKRTDTRSAECRENIRMGSQGRRG